MADSGPMEGPPHAGAQSSVPCCDPAAWALTSPGSRPLHRLHACQRRLHACSSNKRAARGLPGARQALAIAVAAWMAQCQRCISLLACWRPTGTAAATPPLGLAGVGRWSCVHWRARLHAHPHCSPPKRISSMKFAPFLPPPALTGAAGGAGGLSSPAKRDFTALQREVLEATYGSEWGVEGRGFLAVCRPGLAGTARPLGATAGSIHLTWGTT